MSKISRRDLLKTGAVASIAATSEPVRLHEVSAAENKPANKTMIGVPFEKRDKVRVSESSASVRTRTQSMIHDMNGIEHLEIVALCDNVKANAEQGKAMIEKAGKPTPAMYTDGDHLLSKNSVQRDDIDFVYSPTPWELARIRLQWRR